MMTEPMIVEPQHANQDGGPAQTAPAMAYKLRRLGGRPLSFHGSELGMAMSFTPTAPYWYEVNIYRTVSQQFVLVIRHFFQSEQEQDTIRAWECETFGEVMDKLESYDAADDVRVTVNAADPDLSLPEMAAHALDLRAKAEAARQQFSGLVGELLYDLEAE